MATKPSPSAVRAIPELRERSIVEELYETIAAGYQDKTAADIQRRHLAFLDAPPEPRPAGCLPMERILELAVDAETRQTDREAGHVMECVSCGDSLTVLRRLHMARVKKQEAAAREAVGASPRISKKEAAIVALQENFVSRVSNQVVHAARAFLADMKDRAAS